MVIIDDLMLENSKELREMFIFGSHHKKISLLYLTQNIFQNSDLYRLMSANAHYMVIFSNRRNFRQVNTLAHQIFVGKDVNRVLEVFLVRVILISIRVGNTLLVLNKGQ